MPLENIDSLILRYDINQYENINNKVTDYYEKCSINLYEYSEKKTNKNLKFFDDHDHDQIKLLNKKTSIHIRSKNIEELVCDIIKKYENLYEIDYNMSVILVGYLINFIDMCQCKADGFTKNDFINTFNKSLEICRLGDLNECIIYYLKNLKNNEVPSIQFQLFNDLFNDNNFKFTKDIYNHSIRITNDNDKINIINAFESRFFYKKNFLNENTKKTYYWFMYFGRKKYKYNKINNKSKLSKLIISLFVD